ncbi:hypothetical protein BH11MYX1_BH11MYX1_23570 [soil metagenome]
MKFRLALLALISSMACGSTDTSVVSQLNLDRPVDIAFACYGSLRLTGGVAATADQAIVESAMPLEACDIRSQAHDSMTPAPVPPGQEALGAASTPGLSFYYGFILQSEPGTVAIAQWDTKPANQFAGGDVTILDSDPLLPGKNSIAVGENPVAIATDTVGCYEITANAGACDLSTIDINSALLVATDNANAVAQNMAVRINRIPVKNATGQIIKAKAAAMVAEPPKGTIGNACPATPTGLVYIAYPGCHLVAGVDVSTGTIVNGIQYDANGVATVVDGNVTCPDECGTGVVTAGPRPSTLDLQLDERTARRALAVGSVNSNMVTIAELDLSNKPTSLSSVVLEQNRAGDLGVTSVKISPTIGMGGSEGMINDDSALGGQFQFVYAVSTDNTIRVANILNVVNKECDTQIDPRFLHNNQNVTQLSCLPIGDPTLPRRARARGPGIQLLGDSNPTSIEIFRVPNIETDTRIPGTPLRLVGYFGIITASSGATYVLNVDNDDGPGVYDTVLATSPVASAIPLDIAHQLRDAVPARGSIAETLDATSTEQPICDTNGANPDSATGPAQSTRYTGTTTRTLPAGTFATEKVDALPNLRQVKCMSPIDAPTGKPVSELSFAADVETRARVFPDLFGLPYYDETWTLTYEGSISLDTSSSANDGPAVRTSQMYIDADAIRLDDQTHPFCDAGVEPYDIVQLRGCDATLGNSDCPIGYTCFVHPESQIANLGACMLADEADRLAAACKEFLTSQRQYTVGRTTSGELKLLPRKHVLLTTPVDGCTDDVQCQGLANYRLQNIDGTNPVVSTTAADAHTYTCAVDTARAPELAADGASELKRCIQTCTQDADCDTGTVCANGTCMEGVIPPQACVNAPQRYELRASEAFAVVGTHSGYHHPIIEDAGGNCVKNPTASLYDIGRIPLRAAACDPASDPYTGQRADGTFDPNPCETTVDQTEFQNNFLAGTCEVGSPAQSLVTRTADAIRYRGRGLTFTMVNPTYPGDATCIGDRGGHLGNIPIVPKLYQAAVRIVSGFAPLLVSTGAAYPVKVTRGPGQSIWIMDEGDYISTSNSIASTRGKVFRVESTALTVVNTLE